jgi:16S rRNA (cytosine967-C5)-methyltransferase
MSTSRQLAVSCIKRARNGAFINDLLNAELNRSSLEPRDRRFVTELVYGTTRRARSLEYLWRRYVEREPSDDEFAGLQLGTFQLVFTDVDVHAAVNETVAAVAPRSRPLVNAVLRKVATDRERETVWPDIATQLSYPDWIVTRLVADLGEVDADAMLRAMNEPMLATQRVDGYTQDRGSQWVAELSGAQVGERVLDVCAAPGGKATAIASLVGANGFVVAGDRVTSRLRRLRDNVIEYASGNACVVQLDGHALPFLSASFDRVVVDAPCSGLGVLARRPDARWRVSEADVAALADQQLTLLRASVDTVRPGGTLVYSVCTVLQAETDDVVERLLTARPDLSLDKGDWLQEAVGLGFRQTKTGAMILSHDHGTDAMFVARLIRD